MFEDAASQDGGVRGAWGVVSEHVDDITAALQVSLHALDSEVNPEKVDHRRENSDFARVMLIPATAMEKHDQSQESDLGPFGAASFLYNTQKAFSSCI